MRHADVDTTLGSVMEKAMGKESMAEEEEEGGKTGRGGDTEQDSLAGRLSSCSLTSSTLDDGAAEGKESCDKNVVHEGVSHETEVGSEPADDLLNKSERVEDRMKRYYYTYLSLPFHRIAQAIHSIPYMNKAGLDMKSKLKSDRPVFVLGIAYSIEMAKTNNDEGDGNGNNVENQYTQLMSDLFSRPWMTYRTRFECFPNSDFSSDVGWGCTLRSGQMLLAQLLFTHRLGRNWRRGDEQNWSRAKELIRWFRDTQDERSPFSLHSIIKSGREHGVSPGQWLGPYVLCQSIATLINVKLHGKMRSFIVTQDSGGAPTLFIDKVAQFCTETVDGISPSAWIPVAILIPLVLGPFKHINPTYAKPLLATLTFPQSLGIVGGRAGSSHYFIGCQENTIMYLDPHTVQSSVYDIEVEVSDEEALTYFCTDVQVMEVGSMSPSLAVAFYCKDRDDFDDLVCKLKELEQKSGCAPLLTVVEKEPPMREDGSEEDFEEQATDVNDGERGWHLV